MSTLRVSSINNAAASAGGIAIDSSGGVSGALPAPNRNLLYNGAMQVAQRGTSTASITTSGYYTADRWLQELATFGTVTQSVEADAPTGSGFRNSLRVLFTTADSSPAAGDYSLIGQRLEGQDVQRIRKGTSSAQKLTLSFWVKSNVTGTFIAELLDVDTGGLRQVSAAYTISASATWEKKTITFPADTTGALANDNTEALRVNFFLGAGSTYTSGTLATSWAAYNAANRAVGQVNVAAATNNYWQVTGVQLEVGDAATDFEFKSYGQELRECQRYYYRHKAGSVYSNFGQGQARTSTNTASFTQFPVQMRANPSALETLAASNYRVFDGVTSTACTVLAIEGQSDTDVGIVYTTVASGLTSTRTYSFDANNTATAYVAFSAEL